MAIDQKQTKASIRAADTCIPFGLKGPQLLAPSEVPRGLACGCRCPGCDAPLVAKHGTGRRRPHFAHYGALPHEGCAETAIHLCAKQILVKAMKLHLPAWTGAADMPNPPQAADAYGLIRHGDKVHWPRCVADVWGGEPELPRAGICPDVVMQDAGGELLVEVRVTHAVDHAKAQAVQRLDARMVEIDLSKTSADVLANPTAFERWVVEGAPRHWIWLPAAARQWTESLRNLEDKIKREGTPRFKIERQKHAALSVPIPASADWEEFRLLFAARELKPVDRDFQMLDPLVGTSISLPPYDAVKVLERLARASKLYRVELPDGSLRTVFLGYET